MSKQRKNTGISLRMTFVIMLAVSLAVTALLIFTIFRTLSAFNDLSKETDSYMELQTAASDLMSGSDYLTEEVQCYAVLGDREHLNNYFAEAEVTKRREKALALMEDKLPNSPALSKLKEAMNSSLSLMDREYYAMVLVLTASKDTDIPAALQNVRLSAEDEGLSYEAMMEKACRMLHDAEYYQQKNTIRENLTTCLDTLKTETHAHQNSLERRVYHRILWMSILILFQTAGFIAMLVLTTKLGINPLLQAVEHIKKDQSLPIVGANEFRYLATTYNKMYDAYKKSITNLSFKASHDELTQVYNRAGYDLIGKSIDPKSTAFLLIDADKFKTINDTYGHETGDKVLCRLADVLRHSFRSDDYIFRIGGDEFVVMMVHVNPELVDLIHKKIDFINQALHPEKDGVPGISVSVGVAMCKDVPDYQELFRMADAALYSAKEAGRNQCCFV